MFNKKSTNIFGNNHGTIISAVLIMSLMIVSTVPFIPEAEAHFPTCEFAESETLYTPVIYIEEPRANWPGAGDVTSGVRVYPGDSLAYIFLYAIEGNGCLTLEPIKETTSTDGLFNLPESAKDSRSGEDYIIETTYNHYASDWNTTHERVNGTLNNDNTYEYSFDGFTDGLDKNYKELDPGLNSDYLIDTSFVFNKHSNTDNPASGIELNDYKMPYYEKIFKFDKDVFMKNYKKNAIASYAYGYIDIHPGFYRDSWLMCKDKQPGMCNNGNGGGGLSTTTITYVKLVGYTCPGPPPYHCHRSETVTRGPISMTQGININESKIDVKMEVILMNDHDGYKYNNMDGSFYSGDYFAVKTTVDMDYAERKHIRMDVSHVYDDTLVRFPVIKGECWEKPGCTAIFPHVFVPFGNLWYTDESAKGNRLYSIEHFFNHTIILTEEPIQKWELEFGESIQVYRLTKISGMDSGIESLRTSVAAYNIYDHPTPSEVNGGANKCDNIKLYDGRWSGSEGHRYCKISISDSSRYKQILPIYDTTPRINNDRLFTDVVMTSDGEKQPGVDPPEGGEYLDLDRVPYVPIWTWKPFVVYDDDGEFAIDNRLGVAIHYHGSNGNEKDQHDKYPLTYYENKHSYNGESLLTPISSLFYPNITSDEVEKSEEIKEQLAGLEATNPIIPLNNAHFNGLNPHGVYRYITQDCREKYYNITTRNDECGIGSDTYINEGISGNYLIGSIIDNKYLVDPFETYVESESARKDRNDLKPVNELIVFEDRRSKLNGIKHYPSGNDIGNNIALNNILKPPNHFDESGNFLIKHNNDTNSKYYGTVFEEVLVPFKDQIYPSVLETFYNNSTESEAYQMDKKEYEDDDIADADRNIKRTYIVKRIVISAEYIERVVQYINEVVTNTTSTVSVLGNDLENFVPEERYTSYNNIVTNYIYYNNYTIPISPEQNYKIYAENLFLLTNSEGDIYEDPGKIVYTKLNPPANPNVPRERDLTLIDRLTGTHVSDAEELLWGGTINTLDDTAFITNDKTAMFITEAYGSITINHKIASVFDVLTNNTRPIYIDGIKYNDGGESYQYEQYAYSEPRSLYILISNFANQEKTFADVYKYPLNQFVMPVNIISVDSEGMVKPLTIELDIVPLDHFECVINENNINSEEGEIDANIIRSFNGSKHIGDKCIFNDLYKPIIPTKFEDYLYEKTIADSNDRGMAAIVKERAPEPEVHVTTTTGNINEHIKLSSTTIPPEVSPIIAEGSLFFNERADTAYGEVDVNALCGDLDVDDVFSNEYISDDVGLLINPEYMSAYTTYNSETGESGLKLDTFCKLADVREEDEQLNNSLNQNIITIKISGHEDLNNHNDTDIEVFKQIQNITNIIYEVDSDGSGSFLTVINHAALGGDEYNIIINTDRDNILNATRKADTLYILPNANFGKIISINGELVDCHETQTCTYHLNYRTGNFTVTNQWGGQAIISLNTALQVQPTGTNLSDISVTQEYGWSLAVFVLTVIGFIYGGFWLHKKGIV